MHGGLRCEIVDSCFLTTMVLPMMECCPVSVRNLSTMLIFATPLPSAFTLPRSPTCLRHTDNSNVITHLLEYGYLHLRQFKHSVLFSEKKGLRKLNYTKALLQMNTTKLLSNVTSRNDGKCVLKRFYCTLDEPDLWQVHTNFTTASLLQLTKQILKVHLTKKTNLFSSFGAPWLWLWGLKCGPALMQPANNTQETNKMLLVS